MEEMQDEDESLSEDDSLEELETIHRAARSPSEFNSAIQVATLKEIRRMRKDRRRGRGSGEEEDERERRSAFTGLHRERRRFKNRPNEIVKNYRLKVLEDLNIFNERQQLWRYRDLSLTLRRAFGKMRGLWRVHVMASDILQLWEEEQPAHARAMLVQLLKGLHQVAIDGGSWQNANRIIPSRDPYEIVEFAGEEREPEAVQKYNKGVKYLRSGNNLLDSEEEAKQDAGKENAQSKRAKQRQRQKEKAEKETAQKEKA